MFYESIFAVKRELPQNKSVISFTFDDAPVSSFKIGSAILERSNVHGTYYLSGRLATLPISPDRREFISVSDAKTLLQNGHQIGCHTYSHKSLSTLSASEYAADTEHNRAFWQDALGVELRDFSYPLGNVTLAGKYKIRDKYLSLRGIRNGTNRGKVDMACLRATSLSNSTFDPQKIERQIIDCVENGGWLIFFSHGLDEPAAKYFDLSAKDFAWAVDIARSSNAKVLNIEHARQYLFND